MEKRTDLAVEIRESIEKDNEEIEGVVLDEQPFENGRGKMTTVIIRNAKGSKAMGRPIGTYITLEQSGEWEQEDHDDIIEPIQKALSKLGIGKEHETVCVVGLGNQQVTSDALGPKVVNALLVTRHLKKEFGQDFMEENEYGDLSAIAPGVMAQTGMETHEVISSLIDITKPDCLIIVDALASRRLERLCTTVQITDTGISPGSGVGNHRKELSKKSLGVPVVAVGVPTVVDTGTIVADRMEEVLGRQGCSQDEIEKFIHQVIGKEMDAVFVTPKNVDELVDKLSKDIAKAINGLIHNCQPFFI